MLYINFKKKKNISFKIEWNLLKEASWNLLVQLLENIKNCLFKKKKKKVDFKVKWQKNLLHKHLLVKTVFGCFHNSTDYLLNSESWMENIDLQMGMNMKAWQNPYNFAHKNFGWINYQSSKAISGCGCNKLRHSWRHDHKHLTRCLKVLWIHLVVSA